MITGNLGIPTHTFFSFPWNADHCVMGSSAWIISPFCITPILHLQPSPFSLLLHCYGRCHNSAKKKTCLYWRVSLFCCIYSKGEGERDGAELKLAENNSVWQKATKLQKQSNSTEVNQIWKGWDPNMLLTEPLALRTVCGQSDSPPMSQTHFTYFEKQTGALSRTSGFGLSFATVITELVFQSEDPIRNGEHASEWEALTLSEASKGHVESISGLPMGQKYSHHNFILSHLIHYWNYVWNR